MLDTFLSEFLVSSEAPIMIEEQTYVIVEPELVPNLMTLIYQYGVADLKYSALFEETAYDNHSKQGPVLVQLSNENDSFSQLMKLFTLRPCGCFLQTNIPFSKVLDWARNALNVSAQNKISLFRFYEPRMLFALLGALTSDEKNNFLKNINSLYWFHHTWLAYHHAPDPSIDDKDFILSLTTQHFSEINFIQQRYLGLLK